MDFQFQTWRKEQYTSGMQKLRSTYTRVNFLTSTRIYFLPSFQLLVIHPRAFATAPSKVFFDFRYRFSPFHVYIEVQYIFCTVFMYIRFVCTIYNIYMSCKRLDFGYREIHFCRVVYPTVDAVVLKFPMENMFRIDEELLNQRFGRIRKFHKEQ